MSGIQHDASVDAAVTAGELAWRRSATATPAERASWLVAVADGLEAARAELVPLAMRESNLPEARLNGELSRTAFQLRLFADEVRRGRHLDARIDHADAAWPMGPRPDIRRANVPLGVVGVFGASNFPFAFSVIGGDSASALAAGCAVVHKAHSGHPDLARRTAEVVVAALTAVGAPAGLFALVEGRPAARALVVHPAVKAIGFTGSTAGGRALFDLAMSRPEPIPFFGELGSINPVVVTERAWATRGPAVIAEFVGSFTMGRGQFCTKPGILLVPSGAVEAAGPLLRAALSEDAPHALLTSGLQEGYLAMLQEMRERAGVEVLASGVDAAAAPGATVLGASAEAALGDTAIVTEEMFGPASLLVGYGSDAELRATIAAMEGQLTATLIAEDDDEVGELLAQLGERAGRVLWNAWPTGVTVSHAQVHGGPYPATTAPSSTSVGTAAVARFTRPVAFQGVPAGRLPASLRDHNEWQIERLVDGEIELPVGEQR